jgi:metal-responsive CopG/Arc/MetJ family transcriptional regulator
MPDFLPKPIEYTNASVSFDADLLEWLDAVAERTNRSRSNVLMEILRNVRNAEGGRK